MRPYSKARFLIVSLLAGAPSFAGECATGFLKDTFRSNLIARVDDPQTLDYKPYHPTCCAGHGGVCGCFHTSGRLRCCDGFQSPSCKCEKKE